MGINQFKDPLGLIFHFFYIEIADCNHMWQKFKIDLKCTPPSLYQCCNKKMTVSTWEQHYCISTLVKGEGFFFCVFDLLPHYFVHDRGVRLIIRETENVKRYPISHNIPKTSKRVWTSLHSLMDLTL